MELHEKIIREFLKDHPEHIQGVFRKPIHGKEELCLDTPTLKAFVEWTIRTGRGNREKANEFRSWLNDRDTAT